jgi:hypothetical protein
MIDASSKWSAQLITLHNELCGAAPSTSAILCTASFKFSWTVHSSRENYIYLNWNLATASRDKPYNTMWNAMLYGRKANDQH